MKNPHKTIKKEVVLQATFLILVAAVIIPTSGNNAFAKNVQTVSPDNPCGNRPLPLNIKCENIASQVEGSDNVVKGSASQR